MKRLVLMMFIAVLAIGCNGQEELKSAKKEAQKDKKENSLNQPKISWDVKKDKDENGNIIRYDSTYTWSYTNVEGDSMIVGADSVLQSFHSYFNENFPPIWNRSFTQPLWEDSLFYQDFYRDDYFHNRWQQNYFEMDKMFKRMDSMRNQFFYDQYPGMLMPPNPKEEKDKR
jgi:hypothetical protein